MSRSSSDEDALDSTFACSPACLPSSLADVLATRLLPHPRSLFFSRGWTGLPAGLG